MISLKRTILRNTLLKNFSVLTLSNALGQLLSIFSGIKIARSLDPSVYGSYNLLLVHVSIFSIIASFGLRNVIIRTIARDKTTVKKVFRTAFMIRIIGTLFSILIYSTYFFFYHQYDNLLFTLIVICISFSVFFDLFESVAFGFEKMEFSGIINLLSTFCWLVAILLIPKSKFTLQLIFGLFVFFTSLKTIVYFFSIYKVDYIKGFRFEHIEKYYITDFSKQSFPYYYLALFTMLSNQIPILFLEYRSGVAQIGFFNIANKLLSPINLILDTALAAIFPNLSRLFATNYKIFIRNVKLVFILIAVFVLAGAFGLTLFRQEFIHLLYGEKYISSSLVLGYQAWYVALYAIVCLTGTILSAINKQKELGYLSIICTAIQVPILWYGSKYGAEYLSAAFLVATLISLIIHLFVINLYLKNDLSLFFYFKIMALLTIGYLVSLFISINFIIFYKVIALIVIFTVAGYVIFKKYNDSIRKIFVS